MEGLLVALVVGAIAGWLAGQLMKGSGYGLIGDIIIGIIGGFIGRWLWRVLPLPGMGNLNVYVADVITATIGAVVLMFLVRLIRSR
jgi:uncharacterized membrane protein YeaQ/YmgE (transglycosylase-associated protein family)